MLKRVFWSRLEMHYFILQKSSFLQYFFALGRRGLQLLSSKFWWRLNLGGYLINDQTPWLGFLNPCLTKIWQRTMISFQMTDFLGAVHTSFQWEVSIPKLARPKRKNLVTVEKVSDPAAGFCTVSPPGIMIFTRKALERGWLGYFPDFLGVDRQFVHSLQTPFTVMAEFFKLWTLSPTKRQLCPTLKPHIWSGSHSPF